jgi:hypothetical protein
MHWDVPVEKSAAESTIAKRLHGSGGCMFFAKDPPRAVRPGVRGGAECGVWEGARDGGAAASDAGDGDAAAGV